MRTVARHAGAWLACLLFVLPSDALPIENSGFDKLLLNLDWGFGEFGTDVEIQFGVDDQDRGFLKVSETSHGSAYSAKLVEGYIYLAPDQTKEFLALEKSANFSSIPEWIDEPHPDKDANGNELIYLPCNYHLEIWEVPRHDYTQIHTVSRGCSNKPDTVARNYARALVRLAQKHFPDLAASKAWSDVLNSAGD